MPAVLERGAILDGRYEILGQLGSGGMGHVYHARRVLLGDLVAVKVIKTEGDNPVELRARFLQESRLCAGLRHPNIVSILDYNVDPQGRPYLVMEYLNGPSLREEIAAGGRLDVDRVGRIIAPICATIQLAHDRGILHRDLKPANIVSHRFDTGEVVYKVIDFGLANIWQATDATRLTTGRQFLGTVAYASPEQLRGDALDVRADIYSLGAIVYEMLTGELPYEGASPMAIVEKQLTSSPPLPSSRRPGLPSWVDEAVAKAIAREPGHRWASIAAFGRALAPADLQLDDVGVDGGAQESVGGLLDKYALGALIGPGRLGSQIFAGTHRALGHPVAIRTVRRGDRHDWNAVRARFLKEARTLQVNHPNIMQVRDYGEAGDTVYVVTDIFEGVSLRDLLKKEGAQSRPRLHRFVRQIADAASALHRRGGRICGLTPDIIRVAREEEDERLVISSPGISHLQDLLATASEGTLRGTAQAGGELPYVAPEVLMGRPADVRADIFTIGVLAYEIATATLPFQAGSLPELMGAMLQTPPPDPRDRQANLDPPEAESILRCLAPDPKDRYASAAELIEAAGWKE